MTEGIAGVSTMTEGAGVRIVIADDHAVVSEGLQRVLESRPGFRVVGHAADGPAAIQLTQQLQPDLLLLDLAMPRAGGLDVLKALTAASCTTRVMVLTAGNDRDALVSAVRLGARGIMLKESASSVLFDSIRCVMAGQYWLERDNVADLVQALRRLSEQVETATKKYKFGLTPREQQVVAAVAFGESNKEIARRLGISEETIKHHLSNIFDKVGAFSRVELAVFAVSHGLAEPPPS